MKPKKINSKTGVPKRGYAKKKLPFSRGFYTPINPEKYIGDKKIEYRSSWELRIMVMLDTSESIVKWCSEGTVIPYFSKSDGKERRYFSDFTVQMDDGNGGLSTVILEVKPLKQIKTPVAPLRKTEKSMLNYANAIKTHQVNVDKWNHANKYCKTRGIAFLLVYQNKNNSFTFVNYDKYLNGEVRLDE